MLASSIIELCGKTCNITTKSSKCNFYLLLRHMLILTLTKVHISICVLYHRPNITHHQQHYSMHDELDIAAQACQMVLDLGQLHVYLGHGGRRLIG